MTDLLIRDPNDTGEIPTEHGLATENLAPYAAGLPPRFRRPTAVLDLIGSCQPKDLDDEDEFEGIPHPVPVEPEPAPKPADELWQAEPVRRLPRGRHRRPSRWDWLAVPLSAGLQIIRAAWAKDGNR